MKNKKRTGAAGKILTFFLVLLAAAVLGLVYYTKAVPLKYLLIGGAAILVLLVIVGILTWNFYHKGRFLLGLLLWFAMVMGLVLGGFTVYRAQTTLSDITGVKTEVAQVGVYVKTDDSAQSLQDTADYTYGILKDLDRENTDLAISDMKTQLGKDLKLKEYSGLGDLLDSLLKDENGAIIVNEAFLDVAKDSSTYSGLNSMIRQVTSSNVETAVAKTASAVDAQPAETTVPDEDENRSVYVIYVSGVNSQGGIVAKSRSDVNLVMAANMDTKQLLMINTPADYFVPLSIADGEPDKLEYAGIYGINVCMDTMSQLYDVDIHDYIRMNYAGFRDIINSLGGEEALALEVSSEEGDLPKGQKQLAVLEGMLKKLGGSDIMNSYQNLLATMAGSLETNLSYTEITRVLQIQLNNMDSWNVVSYSVTGTEDVQKPYSMNEETKVIMPDQSSVDHAKDMIRQVINGEALGA